MKNMIKDAMILFAITIIAGFVLGTVYEVTKDPIAKQKEKAETEASMTVFHDATSFESINADFTAFQTVLDENGLEEEAILKASKALDESGNPLGYVIQVATYAGYGGEISFSVGIRNDGTVNGISILNIAETPGLGMKAEEVLQPQFMNKAVEQFTYTKSGSTSDSQIDAISGATITSSAVVNGVNAGLLYFQTELGGGKNE